MAASFLAASEIEAPASEVFAWHMRPGAFERLVPPWERIRVVTRDPALDEGSRVVLEMSAGPVPIRWTAVHRDFVQDRQFCDEQEGGPFRCWRHVHRFVPLDTARTRLEDDITYELPLGALGRLAAAGVVAGRLARTFSFRHETTRGDVETHWRYRATPRLAIGVSGASGLIGRHLVPFLTTGGHHVTRLVQGQPQGPDHVAWDPRTGLRANDASLTLDAVVHLAGADSARGRWSAAAARDVIERSVMPTRALAESLTRLPHPPATLVCASAIDIYGPRPDERLTEASAAGSGFPAEAFEALETSTRPAEDAGMRVVHLRLGLVLSPTGGLLRRLLPAFRAGAGGTLGDPAAVWSWVGLDDVLSVVLHTLATRTIRGPVNVTSPEPVTNAEFARTLGRVLKRPALLRGPSAIARLALGDLADAIVTSAEVGPAALAATGYRFRLPSLEAALRHELGRGAPSGSQAFG